MSRIITPLLLIGVLAAPAVQAQEIDTLTLRGHTRFLASDLLRGRDTGSPGEHLAGLYIASRFEALGIRGAGPDGAYRQPVPLKKVTIDHERSRVAVRTEEDSTAFDSGRQFVMRVGGRNAFHDFSGEAVFVGTAEHAERALADRGRLDGRVIVVLGTLGREAVTLVPDWVRRGAEGVVLLAAEPSRFARYLQGRDAPRFVVDAEVDNPLWQPELPIMIAGPALSGTLLADLSLDAGALDPERAFEARALDRTIDARIRARLTDVDAANVAALLPGSDPERRDEVVVYTAHYDHLGVGTPDAAGDSIYNGFSDNAAGVAMLLSIAEAMRDDPPARSVLFLFFTGEERGLLGSSYYVTRPLVPLSRTVAAINLDAGAPPAPPRSWHVAGGAASTLGDVAARVADRQGWTADASTGSPNSDHWPFLRSGVPAAFLIPGQDWEGVTTEEKERLHQRWEHYHQPADEWAPDFPFRGLMRYAEFGLLLGREIADAPGRPRMREADPSG